MERLRRLGREASSAANQRLVLALILSLGLHAVLLYHYVSHRKAASAPGLSIISARIADPARALRGEVKPTEAPPTVGEGRVRLPRAQLPAADPVADSAASEVSGFGWQRESVPVESIPEVTEQAETRPEPPGADLPDPVHYPAKELDVYPRLLAPVAIELPEAGDRPRGRVTLLLMLDESGRVTGTNLVDSEPEGRYEDVVTRAYSGAVFSPARKDGRAVRSRILVAVELTPAAAAP